MRCNTFSREDLQENTPAFSNYQTFEDLLSFPQVTQNSTLTLVPTVDAF